METSLSQPLPDVELQAKTERLAKLTAEIERLKFDRAKPLDVKFDVMSGEPLTDPLRKAETNVASMRSQAVWNIGEAVEWDADAKFNPYSGEQIDPKDDESKLRALRSEISARLESLKVQGKQIPSFDPMTGTQLPEDCLIRLELADPSIRIRNEADQDSADLELGLYALDRMKAIKAKYK